MASPKQHKIYYSDFLSTFKRNPVTKDIVVVTNEKSIINSVRKILLTNHYEIPYNPLFGANIRKYLFEDFSPFTEQNIITAVSKAITNWEPRVNLDQVTVTPAPDNNSIQVDVRVTLINNPTTAIDISTILYRVR